MTGRSKRSGSQIAASVLSIFAVAALAVLLAWLAVQFTVRLTGTFEVIAYIVSWILLPLRV